MEESLKVFPNSTLFKAQTAQYCIYIIRGQKTFSLVLDSFPILAQLSHLKWESEKEKSRIILLNTSELGIIQAVKQIGHQNN